MKKLVPSLNKFLFSKKTTFTFVASLVILLVVSFFTFAPLREITRVNALFQMIDDSKASSADISVDNQAVRINFKIKPEDMEVASVFSTNLGVDDSWMEGMSFNLNPATLDLLRSSLPKHVLLRFSPKQVSLENKGGLSLRSSLTNREYKLASGSGSLNAIAGGDRDYQIAITDPAPLLRFASSSGQLHLSAQMEGIFPILSKVATMTLSVHDSNVDGKIILK